MAKRKKSVSSPVVGDGGQDGGGAGEDAESILDAALGIVRRDLERLGRQTALGPFDAQTVAGYIRAIGGIARARSGRGAAGLGKLSMEELLAEALKVPEVRAALEAGA